MLRALLITFGLYVASQVWAYEQKMIMIQNGKTFIFSHFLSILIIIKFFSNFFVFFLFHFSSFLENVACGPIMCPLATTNMCFFTNRVTQDNKNGSYITACGTCLTANGMISLAFKNQFDSLLIPILILFFR